MTQASTRRNRLVKIGLAISVTAATAAGVLRVGYEIGQSQPKYNVVERVGDKTFLERVRRNDGIEGVITSTLNGSDCAFDGLFTKKDDSEFTYVQSAELQKESLKVAMACDALRIKRGLPNPVKNKTATF